jgi:hypothetical protein
VRKRNKTSSSFEAIAEGAEEETMESIDEGTSRDLESIQPGLKAQISRNRSSSREREFSVLKLSASQLQDFKRLAAFEVLDVHTMPTKSPHKDLTNSPRHVTPTTVPAPVGGETPPSLPLLPVSLESTPVRGDNRDQPLVVVAAKRTHGSSLRVLRLFERGGKGMFRSQSDSDLNGVAPYSFNNPHYQLGQVPPSHPVGSDPRLVPQRSWNSNAFEKYNAIQMKNAAKLKGYSINNTNINNSEATPVTANQPGVVPDSAPVSSELKKFTVQGKKEPRRRQSLPESLPLSPEGDLVFLH